MNPTRQKLEVRLWREDLGGFYRYFLRTLVLDLDSFEWYLDNFKKDSTISLRKYRTATLIGISLVREKIFDKRWMLEELLGPAWRGYFSDKERINRFLDAIISAPEAREHVERANEYLNSNADWENQAVQSVDGQKSIRIAMMRFAVMTHNVGNPFIPYYWKVIW